MVPQCLVCGGFQRSLCFREDSEVLVDALLRCLGLAAGRLGVEECWEQETRAGWRLLSKQVGQGTHLCLCFLSHQLWCLLPPRM